MRPPMEDESPEAELTNAEILSYLQCRVSIKLSSKRLGEALRKAGFPRYQKRRSYCRSWVYSIIYLNDLEIQQARLPNNGLENKK